MLKPGEVVLSIAKEDLSEKGEYSEYFLIVTNERMSKILIRSMNVVECSLKR